MKRELVEITTPLLVFLAGFALGWSVASPGWGIVAGLALSAVSLAMLLDRRRRFTAGIVALTRGDDAAAELDPALLSLRGASGDLYRSVARHVTRSDERWQDAAARVRQQALLLDRMNEGLMQVSASGVVTYANVAASSLFGGRNPVNRSFIGVTRDYELDRALQQCFRTGAPQRHVFEIAGEGRIVDSAIVVLSETPPEALVMLRDITEMNRLMSLRRDFVANVSHELRTPLSTIKILTETLIDLRSEDDEAVRFLNKIDGEVDSMTALVRDLLELTRLESGAGRLAIRTIDVASMVEDVCDRMRPLANRHGVTVEMCVDAAAGVASIDERRLHQALINLISNAIAHSMSGQIVSVRASGDREIVTFEVEDRGDGIPVADLPRVWERFFKTDRARAGPGTGLGLAIVKHIVQAHRGSVSASSVVGAGSTFRITIPRGAGLIETQSGVDPAMDDVFVPG
ncbi:MAG TPA: ATP-binding protein [Thermomicrobiales bacterium]|nr:ATP-binding protein [Thermomicrobiales bacterium]